MKIFIWGGISFDIQSEIMFNDSAGDSPLNQRRSSDKAYIFPS